MTRFHFPLNFGRDITGLGTGLGGENGKFVRFLLIFGRFGLKYPCFGRWPVPMNAAGWGGWRGGASPELDFPHTVTHIGSGFKQIFGIRAWT